MDELPSGNIATLPPSCKTDFILLTTAKSATDLLFGIGLKSVLKTQLPFPEFNS